MFFLNASWDGLDAKYINLGIPPLKEGCLTIGVAIYPIKAHFDDNWLSGAYINHIREYLLLTICPSRFERLINETKLCTITDIQQVKVIDPSILHMAHLLLTEIEYPKPLSQQFASSIAGVIVTHCLRCLE
jgi:hypothetical protein